MRPLGAGEEQLRSSLWCSLHWSYVVLKRSHHTVRVTVCMLVLGRGALGKQHLLQAAAKSCSPSAFEMQRIPKVHLATKILLLLLLLRHPAGGLCTAAGV